MRKYTVGKDQDGLHVVKASIMAYPQLRSADLYHALKRRDIRIDGKKVDKDIAVRLGSEVEIWLPDALFEKNSAPAKSPSKDAFKIAFETAGLLIINKSQGIAVHSGKSTGEDTLIDLIRKETRYKEAELCHRIDMNTGGLVMVAKNKAYLDSATELFRNKLITKRYNAIVLGVPDAGDEVCCDDGVIMHEVSAFLEKTRSGNVYIHDAKQPGDLEIVTRYHVIKEFTSTDTGFDLSELELELVTGRTHQIRAHMAHLGYPVLGDGNYGRNKYNTEFKTRAGGRLKHQQLYSTQIRVGHVPSGNLHSDISGKCFKISPEYELDIKGLKVKA
ncbi:MAG: RluA family pseudouridine synthase [Saccharofermentans sp.]|nr:RluA family pseudouridine synthase [Saccharofermentans sp.]